MSGIGRKPARPRLTWVKRLKLRGSGLSDYISLNLPDGSNQMHRPPQGTLKLSTELSQGNVAKLLRGAGLRPTRQRVALAHLLFAEGDRHVTAETLHEEALAKKVPVSLATVYNTLHQFTEAGLLREVAVEGAKTYFDTNTSNHYHFFCEHSGRLLDIATGSIRIEGLPEAPDGMAISRVDVLVRLVDK